MFKNKNKQIVHFLHIGKTGGSAFKYVFNKYNETEKYIIKSHPHSTTLRDIPEGEKVFFCLRDPLSRFVSGFYSRKRKGQPRIYREWNALEEKVFITFDTANKLACALADVKSGMHSLSISAMENINHFLDYSYWYGDIQYFQKRLDDIVYIGFQETLDDDFHKIKKILGLPPSAMLPLDDISLHKNPDTIDRVIEKRGESALEKWYSQDRSFITLCKKIMSDKAIQQTSR